MFPKKESCTLHISHEVVQNIYRNQDAFFSLDDAMGNLSDFSLVIVIPYEIQK